MAATGPGFAATERAPRKPKTGAQPAPPPASRSIQLTPLRACLLPVCSALALAGLGALPSVRQNPTLLWSFFGASAVLLGWAGIVDRPMLRKYRRHAIFICAIVAAVLTPTPDPLTMSLLAVPLYLLFELGGFLLWALPADRVARGLRPRKEGNVAADE